MRRLWLLVIVLGGPTSSLAEATEPAKEKEYEVVATKEDGIIATGINARGELVGFEWIEEKERPGVISQVPFFAKGKEFTYLPLLKGYTATFPAAVSDDGLVVGRSSKPAPPNVRVPLRNQAFLWDARSGIRGLGTLPDDTASFASDVSSDGRRISGFSVGENRVRACVWDRDGENHWKVSALPQQGRLGSNVVAMSDDGNSIAAVDGVHPCLWTRSPSGEWTREVIGDPSSLIPRGVNNASSVVGIQHTADGLTHAVVWTRAEGMKTLEKPDGYVRAEASALNNQGVVVGMVDGPNGSEVGPRGFVYAQGKLRLIDFGGPAFTAATCINDRGQLAGVVEKEAVEENKADPIPPQPNRSPR